MTVLTYSSVEFLFQLFAGIPFTCHSTRVFHSALTSCTIPPYQVMFTTYTYTHSDFAFTLLNMMSTSVLVRRLSSSLRSRHNLASFDPSIRGAAPFAPKAQNDLNTSSMVVDGFPATQTQRCMYSLYIIYVTHQCHIYIWYCRAQWLRGRASDSRLREPGFESCAAVITPWASLYK